MKMVLIAELDVAEEDVERVMRAAHEGAEGIRTMPELVGLHVAVLHVAEAVLAALPERPQ